MIVLSKEQHNLVAVGELHGTNCDAYFHRHSVEAKQIMIVESINYW